MNNLKCSQSLEGSVEFRTSLFLLKERAVWCRESKSLFIADTHFGKAGHFRKAGIAVPESVHLEDYKSIEYLIHRYRPDNFYFLGDLFHSSINAQWLKLEEFLEGFGSTEFFLVKGNHDILPARIYQSSRLQIINEPQLFGNLILSHEPMEDIPEGKLNLCGHIHPGFSMAGGAKQRLKLSCFYASENQLVLPAFGKFTGTWQVQPRDKEKVYLVTPSKVIPLN
jgi:uncharacterized protein